ncbi:MAG: zinc dependent phospholipase C family protein [Clostridiaceae bacterium]
MKKRLEISFGKTFKGLMFAVNPIKKKLLKTNCTVHKFINMEAINLLKNEGYDEEAEFYKEYITPLNKGVTWADQDFKSSNHFYHYENGKGLYGFSNALLESSKYYNKAIKLLDDKKMEDSIFYFGAACHLIQDTTVPQHVNNKLLSSHRKFELWIISRLMSDFSFFGGNKIIRYDNIEGYIKNNSKLANETFSKYGNIKNLNEKNEAIAQIIIKQAQDTTAGFMLDFYDLIKGKNNSL